MTIVYTSETGFTKEYAQNLSRAVDVPCYDLSQAVEVLEKDAPVFYMGWIQGGMVQGLGKCRKHFQVEGLCGVGIRPDVEHMVESLSKSNKHPLDCVFYLQGGYRPSVLKGGKKKALIFVLSLLSKKIKLQKSITPEETHLLEVFSKGGSFVQGTYLIPLQNWFQRGGYAGEHFLSIPEEPTQSK